MKKRWAVLIGLPVVLVVIVWFTVLSPLPVSDDAIAISQSTGSETPWGVAFGDPDAEVGLVFYTGARVPPEAYAGWASDLADAGVYVAIPDLTLDFAILETDAHVDVLATTSGVGQWVVGGHSLGGVIAARAAADGGFDGLVLMASYPEESNDLSDRTDLQVVSISASEDGLTTADDIDRSRRVLPADTEFVVIDGANHAGFGDYGDQRGDGISSISVEAQHARVVSTVLDLVTGLN